MALADSFIETQRKGSRNVIKGFPFNDYSCGFPSVGETLTLHWLNDFRCPSTKLWDLACTSSCVPVVVNCSIEKDKKKTKIHTHSYKHSFALIHFNPLPIPTLGVSFPGNHTIYWTQTFTNGNRWRESSVFKYTRLFGSLLCNVTPKKVGDNFPKENITNQHTIWKTVRSICLRRNDKGHDCGECCSIDFRHKFAHKLQT